MVQIRLRFLNTQPPNLLHSNLDQHLFLVLCQSRRVSLQQRPIIFGLFVLERLSNYLDLLFDTLRLDGFNHSIDLGQKLSDMLCALLYLHLLELLSVLIGQQLGDERLLTHLNRLQQNPIPLKDFWSVVVFNELDDFLVEFYI
jgi:hypothetical protein